MGAFKYWNNFSNFVFVMGHYDVYYMAYKHILWRYGDGLNYFNNIDEISPIP